jgi:hypothetical protein
MLEDKIIPFLEDLLNNIKNKNLSEEGLRKVSEFYLSYNLLETDNNYSDKDLMNFLSLGWYIYENQVKNIKI